MSIIYPLVYVAIYLPENPPLILPVIDVDPLFIMSNPLRVWGGSKINLVGAGILMEPSEVERLATSPTSL